MVHRALLCLGLALLIAVPFVSGVQAQPAEDICRQEGPIKVFWRYECVEGELVRLQAEFPGLAKYYEIGQSVEGRPIFVLEIANFERQENDADRPGFYLDATHHGNEIQGTEVAMRIAQMLTAQYGVNESLTRWVDEFNIYINPVVNPDGNVRDQRHNVNGVDLNRNYPFEWCVRASACGEGAASEPEVAANVQFMSSKDLDVYASLHTGTWDYVSPRCDKEVSRERAKTDDEELYEYAYAELLEVSGMGTRGASGTGESICWAYDVLEVWSILPEVSTEQFAPAGQTVEPTEQQQEQVEGAIRGILWMIERTGRFGAVLEPELVFDADSSSGIALIIHNTGLQTARNWTLEIENPDKSGPGLFRGNQPLAPGASLEIGIPRQFLGGEISVDLNYDHLNVNPLTSGAEGAIARDPFNWTTEFTQDEVEQVISQGEGKPADEGSVPGFTLPATLTLLALTLFVRRRS